MGSSNPGRVKLSHGGVARNISEALAKGGVSVALVSYLDILILLAYHFIILIHLSYYLYPLCLLSLSTLFVTSIFILCYFIVCYAMLCIAFFFLILYYVMLWYFVSLYIMLWQCDVLHLHICRSSYSKWWKRSCLMFLLFNRIGNSSLDIKLDDQFFPQNSIIKWYASIVPSYSDKCKMRYLFNILFESMSLTGLCCW